jgi:large subunit ribosomal protein L15
MLKKRKKNTRQRANTTHGYGSMKKNRGKGHKGGAGMAGTGKRADTKKPSIWKEKYFGKSGFKNHNANPVVAVNIAFIENKYTHLLEKGMIKEENGVFVVDLFKFGLDKLLGTGTPTRKYKIIVNVASQKAIDKINKAGGEIVISKVVEEKVKEPKEAKVKKVKASDKKKSEKKESVKQSTKDNAKPAEDSQTDD